MSKIKSDRANKLFNDRAKLLDSEVMDIHDYYVSTVAVNEIVIFAEQDAEERAKYALKYALKFMTTLTESQKDAIAMHFEDALNNL